MNLNLKVGDPQQKNNIVVFFLSSDEKKNDNYLSFSQALDQKLVDICKLLGADSFIVKPNTEDYHPKEFFENNGVKLVEFDPVPIPYLQQYDDFISNLSALDYIMNCGSGKLLW